MKIALECGQYLYGGRAVRRYVVALMNELPSVAPEHEFIFFFNYFRSSLYGAPPEPGRPNVKNRIVRMPGKLLRVWWKLFGGPGIDRMCGAAGLVHLPGGATPPVKRAKTIFTLHGISPVLYPEHFPGHMARAEDALVRRMIERNAYFIAVSETTKKGFVGKYNVPPERVAAIPLGVDDSCRPVDVAASAPVLKRFGIDFPYVLFVGATESWKNINGILKSFAVMKKRGRGERLVLAGGRGHEPENMQALIDELGVRDDVIFTGYVRQDTDELPALYSGASLLLYPTLCEGWTSPPLEAMSCGAPVVASNVSSLPETCGDAAAYADPHDHEAIAEKAIEILGDPQLKKNLVEAGKKHASRFTWKQCAEKTLRFYEKVASD